MVADGRVLTYIAGTPVVTSPYLGSRPAFDGSDYLVNISSINRDIRLMQQRRNLYRAYEKVGYSAPNMPIIMLSGKAEPMGYFGRAYNNNYVGDWTFASSELDVAAFLNDKVEAYMGIAYNQAPPPGGGQRVANSLFGLNMGFINIGDLDETPFYLTAGQLYAPFARYSTGMVSAPLTMVFSRVRTRPIILGYKSQSDSGPFAAAYAYRTDTTLGDQAAGGFNWGYIVNAHDFTGEFGVSYLTSVDDAAGMQYTGPSQANTFAGFASLNNGSEAVAKTPAGGTHVTISFDRYNLTAEWITNLTAFRPED
ncbi:MAG: LbtU family siderophore porin, partial [Chitinophagia bacterium]|nr:LbtU family siderophore porin [Chitinophagia bacterium]